MVDGFNDFDIAAVTRSLATSSYHSIFPKHQKNSHSRSFKGKKNFSGRLNSSLEKGSSLVASIGGGNNSNPKGNPISKRQGKNFSKRNNSGAKYSS